MRVRFAVIYSRAHQENREIGEYDDIAAAEAAARKAGAIGEPQISGRDQVYAVAGHEDDDDYGIWVEPVERDDA
jgi:hypothetical protein